MRTKRRLIGCLLLACVLSGCSGETTEKVPSQATRGDVAARFATAVLHGDPDRARALLTATDDGALATLVRRAAAPWTAHHASVRLPGRRAGDRWTFGYAGKLTQPDGRFERQTGNLVVVVATAAGRANVRFFAFTNVRRRFSTHHDSQLPPSKR